MTTETKFTTYDSRKQAFIINQLMELFKSNNRGYGVGEFQGAKFNEEKQKWYPGGVRWCEGETTAEQWRSHLSGVRLLGQGVLCDDNRVWYASLDVDTYDIEYIEEMEKVKRSGLPLVVFRTKSGGLRVTVFFSEPVEAELVVPRMRRVASILGYAHCEIFPKQTRLLDIELKNPSWIYMPYGGTGVRDGDAMFPEQGCMNDIGNLMDVDEAVAYAFSKRISQAQFFELFAAEDNAKANGKANGRKHPKGSWIQEATYETTINTMFCDGPPCLWTISHQSSRDMQNNFLLNVATFLKRKYPENWDKALEWVNYNVLKPVGDREKLNGIVKRLSGAQEYEYMCKQEPICAHCNPHACRRMPYGVGATGGVDHFELGLTIIKREPRIFIANVGDNRMILNANEILGQQKYKEKCLSHGVTPPRTMKKEEWENLVNQNIENATMIEPSPVMRTNARELEILSIWFTIRMYNYLRQGDKPDDMMRVNPATRRIHFKEKLLMMYCYRDHYLDAQAVRSYIQHNCEYHKQDPGSGLRDWWRYTYSISFDVFDEDQLSKWFNRENKQDKVVDDEQGKVVDLARWTKNEE